MRNLRTLLTGALSLMTLAVMADDYTVDGQFVTIPVEHAKAGGAKVVRLQVVNDNIIRVQATSKAQLPQKQSLMIVKQTAKPKFTVNEDDDVVSVKAANVEARVDENTGRITFYDAHGKQLLQEAKDGKQFWDFTVPERELGMKTGYSVPE